MFEIDDRTATEVLWRTHAASMERLATVLVGPSDANEVVVDTFLHSVPFLLSGSIDSPRAYLLRALVNRTRDVKRSQLRRWTRDLAAVGPKHASAPDTFIDVRRTVATLSVDQRAVVYFTYWEGRTQREIADLLHLSPGTVQHHLTRAKALLRKALQ